MSIVSGDAEAPRTQDGLLPRRGRRCPRHPARCPRRRRGLHDTTVGGRNKPPVEHEHYLLAAGRIPGRPSETSPASRSLSGQRVTSALSPSADSAPVWSPWRPARTATATCSRRVTAPSSVSATPDTTARSLPATGPPGRDRRGPRRRGLLVGVRRRPQSSPSVTPASTALRRAFPSPLRSSPWQPHLTAGATGSSPRAAESFTYGDAPFLGSAIAELHGDHVVAMAATPDGRGYWLAAAGGRVFAFGDAHSYGSATGDLHSDHIVAMAATPGRPGLLARLLGRPGLPLRRRPVLRLGVVGGSQEPDRRRGGDSRWQGLLAASVGPDPGGTPGSGRGLSRRPCHRHRRLGDARRAARPGSRHSRHRCRSGRQPPVGRPGSPSCNSSRPKAASGRSS